jgi:hypothetical protein
VSDINYNINANVNKGELQLQLNAVGKTVTMSTAGFLAVTLQLGTATSAINTASASQIGYCLARNLSTSTAGTATVSFGRLSGTTLFETVQLKPGEAAWLRLAPGNYAARAAAATTPLMLQILED